MFAPTCAKSPQLTSTRMEDSAVCTGFSEAYAKMSDSAGRDGCTGWGLQGLGLGVGGSMNWYESFEENSGQLEKRSKLNPQDGRPTSHRAFDQAFGRERKGAELMQLLGPEEFALALHRHERWDGTGLFYT